MWLILRGAANFIGALTLIIAGFYPLVWAIFYVIEGLQGHSHGGLTATQLLALGIVCFGGAVMAFTFAAFLATRGWHLVRRRWPAVPKVTIEPALLKTAKTRAWIASAVLATAVVPPYFIIWGWPATLPHPATVVAYVAGMWLLTIIPSMITHELLHAVAWWITGRVPSQQIRFGADIRTGIAYAYTHQDMPVWAHQVSLLLPALVLAIVPAYTGIFLRQPMLIVYGLLMAGGSGMDLYMTWRTLAFPARASLNESIESDEVLRTAVQTQEPAAGAD